MRSFIYLFVSLFFLQATRSPFAHADAAPVVWTPRQAVQLASETLDEMGIQLFDEENREIRVGEFSSRPRRDFSIVSTEDSEGPLRLRVKLGDVAKGLSFTLVAIDEDNGKVLSRRRLSIDSTEKDAVAVRVKFHQALQSMEREVQKNRAAKHATASPFAKLKLAFVSLFGIPVAKALTPEQARFNISMLFFFLIMLALGAFYDTVPYKEIVYPVGFIAVIAIVVINVMRSYSNEAAEIRERIRKEKELDQSVRPAASAE